MQSQVSQLEKQLTQEQNRRLNEGLRSLTQGGSYVPLLRVELFCAQGGRFIVHKQHERAVRHVWYDPVEQMLNWGSQKIPVNGNAAHLWQIKSQPIHQISEICTGMNTFPKAAGFGLGALRSYMQKKIGGQTQADSHPVENNCLSILFINNKALNLEIPAEGNGCSRDTWVEALQSIIKGESLLLSCGNHSRVLQTNGGVECL